MTPKISELVYYLFTFLPLDLDLCLLLEVFCKKYIFFSSDDKGGGGSTGVMSTDLYANEVDGEGITSSGIVMFVLFGERVYQR